MLNRLLAVIVALALGFSAPAFAASKTPTVTIKPFTLQPLELNLPFDPLGWNAVKNSSGTAADPVATIRAFTVSDLQGALSDAQAFTVVGGGVNYAVGDTLLLGDGVTTLKVDDALNGAITVAETTVAGPMATGAVSIASGPILAASTSGKGTGASFSQNDPTAAACYEALIPLAQQTLNNPLPTSLGGFQLFQKGRDLANNAAAIGANVTNGPLNKACAPLVLSTVNTINLLGAAVGVKLAIAVPKI